MEIKLPESSARSFLDATEMFFKGRHFGNTQDTFFKLFQCWTASDCHKSVDLSSEEFAMFCDELLGLVSATYLVYQASKGLVSIGGTSHA